MDESVLWTIASIAAVLLLLIAIVLIWLWRGQQKLRREVQTLTAQLQRSSDDLVGLCSAAVVVDQRLALNESRLNGMQEKSCEPQAQLSQEGVTVAEQQGQGYELAIEKIRQGAKVDDLVKSCGLTHDEALLLMRLHGKK